MKNTSNNSVNDFRYHVEITIDENSLRGYLRNLYVEDDFSNVGALEDCIVNQYGELEVNWPVRVYDNHSARHFVEDVSLAKWSYCAREEYSQELKALDDLSFIIYSDNRDELNECVNHIEEHCKRHNVEGHVSNIVFHVRPIEYGERDF